MVPITPATSDRLRDSSPSCRSPFVAEGFLPYVAVRYRSDRISQSLADTILAAMANRIDYLDAQSFDMHPIE